MHPVQPDPNPVREGPKPVPTGLHNREPAVLTGGSISLLLYAIYGILRSRGIVIDDDLAGHIETIIVIVMSMPAVAGFVTRFLVFSPASAVRIANRQYTAGLPPTEPQPDVPPPADA